MCWRCCWHSPQTSRAGFKLEGRPSNTRLVTLVCLAQDFGVSAGTRGASRRLPPTSTELHSTPVASSNNRSDAERCNAAAAAHCADAGSAAIACTVAFTSFPR